MTDRTRRWFLRTATATAAVGVAGCSGQEDDPNDGSDGDSMDDGMTDATDDGMTDSMDGEMTETMDGMTESRDDGMTDSMGNESTDSMGGEMTEMTDDEMTDAEDGEMTDATGTTETFTVTVSNVSEPGTITTSGGDEVAVPLSPTAYAVHTDETSAFEAGEPASDGLESLAEDGAAGELVGELEGADGVLAGGVVATPDGAEEAGPLAPGESYTFEVDAGHDARLTVAAMFVQSNDLFYAPDPAGIPLFDGDEALNGDVTDRLALWDAGTEENQEPGAGPDQAPRQSGADTGPEAEASVRRIEDVDDGYEYPNTSDVIEVTVSTM